MKAMGEDDLKPSYSAGRRRSRQRGCGKKAGEGVARKIRCWFLMGCVSKFQGESYENWAFLAGVAFCGDHAEGVSLRYTLKTSGFSSRQIIEWWGHGVWELGVTLEIISFECFGFFFI